MTVLHRHLRKWFEKAICDYNMLSGGDRVLVAVSGGADSLTMLNLLCGPKVNVSEDVEVVAAYLDLGFERNRQRKWRRLERYFQKIGCDYVMEKTEIGPWAHRQGQRKNPCFLCARQRRKRLFEIANQRGCNKMALGHHKDDIIETFLLNVLFGREISTMVPKQEVFSGQYHIVRPMAYIDEYRIKAFASESKLPVLANSCPTSRTSQRVTVKRMLARLEREHCDVRDNVFKALSNVKLGYLLPHSS